MRENNQGDGIPRQLYICVIIDVFCVNDAYLKKDGEKESQDITDIGDTASCIFQRSCPIGNLL